MIHYYVNEKKRSVIGVMKNTSMDAINHVSRRLPGLPYVVLEAGYMPPEFRTEVVCNPADEFDVEVGKKIAKKRLLDNYDRSRTKAEKRMADAMDDILKDFKKYNKRT